VMGEAYPELVKSQSFVRDVVAREEERFRQTLKQGTTILGAQLDQVVEMPTIEAPATVPKPTLAGSVAFELYDTHGFPLELTKEIAAERGVVVDEAGFQEEMAAQKQRAKEARKADGAGELADEFSELLDQFGPTEFTGRDEYESKARVLAVVPEADGDKVSVVLDRTPFYAESGGQIGDTGTISSGSASVEVLDTVYGAPGLVRHRARPVEGRLEPGDEVSAAIDADRRDAIRRNHTATHLLHWALRQVLGDHVKQQGSLVAPDRLRFDFSHYEALTPDEITRIEDLVNRDVLANYPARHYETTKDYAEQVGAIAFFGDKYGDIVRVLEAGPHSVELCGGTHVRALGDIGPVKVVSEGSIGSNIRRLEAVSGLGPIERLRREEAQIGEVARLLGVADDDMVDAVERRLAEIKELRDEIKALKREAAAGRSTELVEQAVDGVVVARVDSIDRDALRDLALAVRERDGVRAVVLGSAPEGGGVAIVSAVRPDSGLHASELIAEAARTVKGGTGKNAELAIAGGKDPAALDEALAQVRAAAGVPDGS
jgi:alanyl-tRNA synthetase